MTNDLDFIKKTIQLADENVQNGHGGPFAAIIVKEGKIIATGVNSVTSELDPTAHAEIKAIRNACKALNTYQLNDCIIYSSCEPCPMCLGAIYWSRPKKIVFAANKTDAANAGFDDSLIYDQLNLPIAERKIETVEIALENKNQPFLSWTNFNSKIDY
ncbi:MAG: nucleoside deaminase [Bacteroidales bacterium]|nr:nucleoside deaminase [Bacteroidales bacterium]